MPQTQLATYAAELERDRADPQTDARTSQRFAQIASLLNETRSNVTDLVSPQIRVQLNLIHLQHVFEGYRAQVEDAGLSECPYSPDSAKARSWNLGSVLASSDLGEDLPHNPGPNLYMSSDLQTARLEALRSPGSDEDS